MKKLLIFVCVSFLFNGYAAKTQFLYKYAEIIPGDSTGTAAGNEIERLRKELMMHFLEPESHMALAKYYYDRGDRLLAFYILEYARHRFEEHKFNQTFEKSFLFDNSKEAEANLLKKYSEDKTDTKVLHKLADIYISRGEWKNAKIFLLDLIKLDPKNFSNIYALAEVYRREGKSEMAEKLLTEFSEKNPKSKKFYIDTIEPLMDSNSQQAKKLLMEAIKEYPNEGDFYFNLGVIFQNEGKINKAKVNFEKGASFSPDSVHIQGWVGRFFLKVLNDDKKALDYYLNAYFLNPHFYDTEYAEYRIRKINWELSKKEFDILLEKNTPLEEILENNNSVIVGFAIQEISQTWNTKYIEPLIKIMGHDDPSLRWGATEIIMENVNKSFDKELKKLLSDSDLRKRGLAAYIAVWLWGKESFDYMREFLISDSQLLRFDAYSALLKEGGEEGLKIVLQYREKERHPLLLKILESIDKK